MKRTQDQPLTLLNNAALLCTACHGALAVAGVAAFERGNWTQSYAKHVCPRLSPKAKMKILFLLHALLKEIQECLSYQSQEFFKVSSIAAIPHFNISIIGTFLRSQLGNLSRLVSIGRVRMRLAVAAKIAFVTAGATTAVGASPKPPGASELLTRCVSTTGASSIRSGR
jgi:hypothetical protein